MTPRTVVIPGDGTNSLSFTIPSNVDFNVESVVASVDASGAGDTTGELTVAEVTGAVIATKRQGLPIPAGDTGTETWALRLLDEAAAAAGGAGFPWAQAGVGGAYNVTSGVTTEFGIDPGTLITTDSSLFGEDTTAGGVTGVALKTVGTWLGVWGVKYVKLANPQLANPENFVAYAQDVSSSIFVGLDQLGSLYGRGFNDIGGVNNWTPGWSSLFTTHGATAAGHPVHFTGKQSTGVTLQAYTQVLVFQILPTAIF